jgi:hypothetical protein
LLVSYEIQPILQRIKTTFVTLIGVTIAVVSYWFLFVNL